MANIMVVDDSKDLLEVLSTYLHMIGHNVYTVFEKEAVKNAISVFAPDLILIDVRLNEEDGRELCREIKEKYYPIIPVILLSASPELLKNYQECKADTVIEKPFNLQTLMEYINWVLNKYQKIA